MTIKPKLDNSFLEAVEKLCDQNTYSVTIAIRLLIQHDIQQIFDELLKSPDQKICEKVDNIIKTYFEDFDEE
jgi:hypothetical protein